MSKSFEKHVPIEKIDEKRNVAVGICMEPNVVDQQGDFERPDTIGRVADGYMERLGTGDANSGVMHATFPSQNVLSHVENRVLAEPAKIGDTEYPAGTWQIGVKVRDETLQSLIDSDTLTGFSIGGFVQDTTEYAPDDLPDDVRIDDGIRDAAAESEAPIREITEATIHEVSLVDHPAVESAQIQTAKADGIGKAAGELTESADAATEYLVGRGHDESEARELAEFLNREKAGNPAGWLSRAKRFFSGESGGSGGESALQQSRTSTETDETEKDGRTLSRANIESTKAAHDAMLDMLSRSDVDHGRRRFTDDPADGFDVGSYGATDGQESSDSRSGESGRGAGDVLETMNEDELNDKFETITERLDGIEDKMDGNDEQEQTSEEEKNNEAGEETDETAASEKVDQLAENQQQMADAIERVAEMQEQMADANGITQQADVSDGNRENEKAGESLDGVAGLLG